MIKPHFTLCFLTRGDKILMLHRQNPPNQGLWNGVGGHLEPGESPYQSCLREAKEETGYDLKDVHFSGILTWEGFEIPAGGLYLFIAPAPSGEPVSCSEGELCWQHKEWACHAPEVVSNLHLVLPHLFNNDPAQVYHFVYQNNLILKHKIIPLPSGLNIHAPWQMQELI